MYCLGIASSTAHQPYTKTYKPEQEGWGNHRIPRVLTDTRIWAILLLASVLLHIHNLLSDLHCVGGPRNTSSLVQESYRYEARAYFECTWGSTRYIYISTPSQVYIHTRIYQSKHSHIPIQI